MFPLPNASRIDRREGGDLCFWYHSLAVAEAKASCQHRIGNFTELLRGATAVVSETLPGRALLGKAAIISPRPFVNAAKKRALAAHRARGLCLVGDFDDLLFAEPPPTDAARMCDQEQARRLIQRWSVYRDSLDVFDAFTVSTEPLADYLRALRPGAPVHVVPNGVSLRWVSRSHLSYPQWRPGDPKLIRYLPGSPSHDDDFGLIARTLAAFLRAHHDVRLEVVGPLKWDSSGFPKDRVVWRPRVPYERLGAWLGSSWVNLAPLCATEFNRCKSSVKYLEAAAMGCPTIATSVPDLVQHRGQGVLLPDTPQDWYDALSSLLDDERRMRLGRRAQVHVLSRATARQSVDALLKARTAWGCP